MALNPFNVFIIVPSICLHGQRKKKFLKKFAKFFPAHAQKFMEPGRAMKSRKYREKPTESNYA